MRWIDAARTRLRMLVGRRGDEARMDEEFRFHLDMETERLVREEGLDPAAARRRAVRDFGVVEDHKDALHEGRGLAWLGGLALDFRLGFRMLVKYPGLTVVAGFAMAFGIWAGAVVFEIITMFLSPTVPLRDGDRIVQVRQWDARTSDVEPRVMHDFANWRGRVQSVTGLGAFRDAARNITGSSGETSPFDVAEMSATGFDVAAVRPLLGRTLTAEDERPGAAPVVVLGYELWRDHFAADSGVVGRSVQVGGAFPTVVGVMPEGFEFPVAHDAWMPLVVEAAAGPREGTAMKVFGRLAPGVSLDDAQAELAAHGRRASADLPQTHADLRPQVKPWPTVFYEANSSDLQILLTIQLFATLLLVVTCSTVAMLLFARMATRENELVVRTALGATRGRIVGQLFAEALVLGGAAAVVGLLGAELVLGRWATKFLEINLSQLPFWYDPHLSVGTIAFAAGLTVLAAAIAGALPALRVTRDLGSRLKAATAGGGGLRFGGVWTAVIVTQVALTVAFPAVAWFFQQEIVRIRSQDVGFAAREFLGARIELAAGRDASGARDTSSAGRERDARTLEQLRQQVAADHGVAGVTFVDSRPREWHPDALVDVEGAPGATGGGAGMLTPDVEVSIAAIGPSYFDVLGAPLLAGRAFHSGDLSPDARVVIVDQGFVRSVLQGRSAIGWRVRFRSSAGSDGPPNPWYEIVGVAKDLGMAFAGDRGPPAGLYLPVPSHLLQPIQMLVHARGDAAALGPRLHAIAASVHPDLHLTDVQPLDEVASGLLWFIGMWLRIVLVLTLITLVLSLAGIYAVLSFTVARRTREIGIRVALGATHRQVVAVVFRRPLVQVAMGVAAGGALIAVATTVEFGDAQLFRGGLTVAQGALLAAYVVLMFGICLLACIVPTRRALAVEPSVALRVE